MTLSERLRHLTEKFERLHPRGGVAPVSHAAHARDRHTRDAATSSMLTPAMLIHGITELLQGLDVPVEKRAYFEKVMIGRTLLMCCSLAVVACRDRPRYVGPESLVFDVEPGPEVARQTVTGMVRCPSCPSNATTMMIELSLPHRVSTAPVATVGFEQLGAYRVTVSVPYGELLDIRATLFTAGGIRKTSASAYATDDDDVDEAAVIVDLAIP